MVDLDAYKIFLQDLQNIVGAEHVTDEDFATWAVSGDIVGAPPTVAGIGVGKPDIVVRPQCTADVSRILMLANRHRFPVVPAGAKSGAAGGVNPIYGGLMVDMLDMNNVVDIDERAMTVTVQAGCTWAKMHTALEKKGYRTGVKGPHGNQSATVGGSVSAGSYMIDGTMYGVVGDEVVSLEVVLPNGDVIRTGSRSNVNSNFAFRNCNGPDLTGLFCNSQGTLGVITEVTLRMYPLPEYTYITSYTFDTAEAACEGMYRLEKQGYIADTWMTTNSVNRLLGPLISEVANIEGLLSYHIETNNKKILDAMREDAHKLLCDAGGKALPLEAGRAAAIGSAYDKLGLGGPPLLALGNLIVMGGIMPVLVFKENVAKFNEIGKKYENLCVKVPNSDFPFWILYAQGLKRCMTNVIFAMGYDPLDKEVEKKFMKIREETVMWEYGFGAAAYWIGHIVTPMLVKNYDPRYHAFLRTIKKIIDPNKIMNEGVLYL